MFSVLRNILFFILLSTQISLHAQSIYPEIKNLSKDADPYFLQLQNEIESYYQMTGDQLQNSEIMLYSYKIDSTFNIFQISAILNLPYDTITTINEMTTPSDFKKGQYILIPSQPGIAVPVSPRSDYQKLLTQTDRKGKPFKKLVIYNGNASFEYLFYPGESLNRPERTAFLQKQFKFPTEYTVISSQYGYRIHPFSGKWSFHNGIDLKMDINTEVYASFNGKVKESGYSEIYGYYIILQHQNGFETMYGHLSSIYAIKSQTVSTGDLIAYSGNSGLSSGPHLHFEIRKDGKAVNPLLYLQKGRTYVEK